MLKHLLLSKKIGILLIVLVALLVGSIRLEGANRYSVVSGNWNSTSTWSATSGGPAGASVPVAGDAVFIEAGDNVTVSVDEECTSIIFTNTGATLTINSTFTLVVSGDITLNSSNGTNYSNTITGGGSINCVSLNLGSNVTPSSDRSTSLIISVSELNISSNLTLYSSDNGSSQNNAAFNYSSGTVTVNGSIVTTKEDTGQNTSTFNMATGSQSGTLVLNGGTPFNLSTGTNTLSFNGTSSTVNYSYLGDQIVGGYSYRNLTLSGSGIKSLPATITINGNLSLSGSVSATTAANETIGGNLDVGAGATFASGTNFTLGVTGTSAIAGTLTLAGTGTKTFTNDVTISGVWNETGSGAVGFAGNFTNNATTFTANVGTHTFSGTTKTIGGSTITSIQNVTITGTRTNNGTLDVSTALIGIGTLTQGNNSMLLIGGSSGITALVATASGNTVNYDGAGNQTVKAVAYSNLILSGSGTKSILAGTSTTGYLNIAPTGSATVSVGAGLTISVNSLTLGVEGTGIGTFGGSGSGSNYIRTDYFAATSGKVSIATNTCTTTPTISGTLDICIGSSTQLTGSGTAATINPWVSASTSIATVNSAGLVQGVASGSSVITYTNNFGCSQTVTLTVKSIPTASAGGSQTICENGTATVSGASSSNGNILWTHNGSGSLSNVTTLTPMYNSIAGDVGTAVTLTMTVSNSPCTVATSTYTVNVSGTPTAPATTGGLICIGSTATLSASGAGSSDRYTWYNAATNGTLLKTSTNNADNTYTTPVLTSNTDYWVSILNSNGCEGPRTQVTATFPSVSTDDQNLAGSNSWIGHVYDGTNYGVAFNGNFANYYGNYSEPEIIDQNFGGDYNCFSISSNSATRLIYGETFSVRYRMNSTSRKGLYVVDLGSDDGSRLSVDGMLVYNNWADQGFSSRPRNLISLNGNSSLVYEFYENAVNNRVVFNNLTLVLANNLSANYSQDICMGLSGSAISGDSYGTLPTGIAFSGTGYQWAYSTNSSTGPWTDIPTATAASYTPSSSLFNTAGTYYIIRKAKLLSVSNNTGVPNYVATNESNVATVTVNSRPTANITSSNTIICNGSSTDITGTVTATGAWTLTLSNSGGTVNGTGSGSFTKSVSPTTTTTYTLSSLTDANCTSIAADLTGSTQVTVNNQPTATSGGSQTICQNGTATVSGASSTNGSILWTHSGSGSLSNATTLTPTYNSVAGDAGTTVTLTMTVSNSPCISATATYTVNVSATPTASAGGSQTICQNGTATVSGAGSTNGSILWTHSGSGSLSNATTLTPTYNSVAGDAGTTVTLTMTVSNSPCISATATYTVNVSATPTASAGGSQTICQNGTATVSGASSSNGTILWTENGAGSITAGATTLTPTYTAAASDAGTTVTLTMTVSNSPCTDAITTYMVIVNPLTGTPIFTAGAATICQNDSDETYSATAANSSSIAFSVSPAAAGVIEAATGIMNWSPTFFGTATITATATGTCGISSAERIVTVNPLPATGEITTD